MEEHHLNLRLNSAPYQIATSVKDDKKIIKSELNLSAHCKNYKI
jgi:hypothetical protein